MKQLKFYLAFLLFSLPAIAQEPVRIASYNLLNYPGNNTVARNEAFRKILREVNPDILVVQEMTSQAGVDLFKSAVLDQLPGRRYSAVAFHDGKDSDNALFYDSATVRFDHAEYFPTALRDIAAYVFIAQQNDVFFDYTIYSVHLKASEGSENEQARLAETSILVDSILARKRDYFILAGDFNTYSGSEPAYRKLTVDMPDKYRLIDPLNAPGNWSANQSFAYLHTQSPRVRSFGGGATGGLDDRFDFVLPSFELRHWYIQKSYTAYGNDGKHFNDSINRLPNEAVPDSIANALHIASDHLPVYADFRLGMVVGVEETRADDIELRQGAGAITVNAPAEYSVSLYTVFGQEVFSGKTVSGSLTMPSDGYAAGTYILKIQAHKQLIVRKLILP